MDVCVVALGKVGLPVAVQFASRGLRVRGCDVHAPTVAMVNAGEPPFPGEAELDVRLADAVRGGLLTAHTDTADAVRQSDVIVVLVPLIVDADRVPDFRALDAATRDIAKGLKPGALVIYETTLPVGTTRHRFGPMLAEGSGLRLNDDFSVAFSPERVFSGRIFRDLRKYPKVVGGLDERATEAAAAFYEAGLEFELRPDLPQGNGVWRLGGAEDAELCKLIDTTYRDVNIALANEFSVFADRIGSDLGPVIEAANSQLQAYILRPGIAVGGHCIPVYPYLYLSTHQDATLPAASRVVNESMPGYAVSRLASLMGGLTGCRVVVLGASYRGGVKESAFSGVFSVVQELARAGAVPLVHDPLYSDDELRALGFEPYHLGERCEGAVVQADHAVYRTLGPDDLPGVRAVLDGRDWLTVSNFTDRQVPVAVIGRSGKR